MLNKVPEVTIYFWVIKVLATTVGETAADFLRVSRLTGQPQRPNGQVIKQTTSSNGFVNADLSPDIYSKANRLNVD